ncbi:MAG TPA: exosortase/archaeosortase family protein [Opitutaceae bacterium]|nr:exosortase/archaeosortase family protein [Opitutaceae bacterium]
MSSPSSFAQSFVRLSLIAKLNLIGLAVGIVALSLRLWPEWRHNPDLSHGLFMPLIFLLLLHESRVHGPGRFLPPRAPARAGFALLLLGGLFALVAAGLYAAAVDWSHALVNFMLALALAWRLGAALISFAGERVRFIGFNWTACVAVFLWVLSAPIPPGTYLRLTLALQLWVTEGVLRTLHLLGIAAVRHGNIIEMATSAVGVEEACSGIRSLISCIFAGFLFSATLVRRPFARALIIVLSVPIALAMNFLRSLLLTLLANKGVHIAGTWHDLTGFGVLAVTAILLGGVALLLERGPRTKPAPAPAAPASARSGTQVALGAGLAVALSLMVIFVLNTRPSVHRNVPAPNLLAVLPASADGWQVMTSDLYEFRGPLQTDHLAQRRYVKSVGGEPVEVTLYLAYWPAGQAPVSLVAIHTPDACWPGAGWTPLKTRESRMVLTAGERRMADAEYRLFKTGDYPQHVWFWHLYDRSPIVYRDPYSPVALLRIAWRFGFRHDGDQVFVRVSSNRPWSDIAGEPLLAQFFARTQALGL